MSDLSTDKRDLTDVTGLVLSGGRSSRHAGQDKGWLLHDGRPLIESALAHLQGCRTRLISANRHIDRYQSLGVSVLTDHRGNFEGPLSGIETAMMTSDSAWLYVVPVDVIGMPPDWCAQLWQQAIQTQSPWVGTLDGDDLQPLLGLWSTDLLSRLSDYLNQGGRRVMEFIAPWRVSAMLLPDGYKLANLNHPSSFLTGG